MCRSRETKLIKLLLIKFNLYASGLRSLVLPKLGTVWRLQTSSCDSLFNGFGLRWLLVQSYSYKDNKLSTGNP
uniref:Ovule protein n=1 Tax=Steinernema glaseri TaxID=37863 RepID=A0A1I7ZE62_9BILA